MHLVGELTMEYRHTACVACNLPRRPDDAMIDLGDGAVIDFEGRLALCETCLNEANALLGVGTPLAIAKMQEHVRAVEAENISLREKLNEGKRIFA